MKRMFVSQSCMSGEATEKIFAATNDLSTSSGVVSDDALTPSKPSYHAARPVPAAFEADAAETIMDTSRW